MLCLLSEKDPYAMQRLETVSYRYRGLHEQPPVGAYN